MKQGPPKAPLSLTIAGWFLALVGWAGVVLIFLNLPFNPGSLWLVYVAWFMALTGTALPFIHYLNRRFARTMPSEKVMLRQAMWVGVFGAVCAWLQIPRALNLILALLVAAALIAIEVFLLLRARSRWRPEDR